MKTEHKYYVEWSVDGHLHRGEVILGKEIPLTERFPFVKAHIEEYYESITKAGTKVRVRKVVYKGIVLRIS
jgi:hypothetical protein